MSSTVLLLCFLTGCLATHELRIRNQCNYEVWVGLLGNSIPDQGGYALASRASRTSIVPNKWSGRVWGRTHCSNGRCETGDCARGVHCNGAGGIPPATLAEITFDAGSSSNQDFYDVSLVDGYNLKMTMEPVRHSYTGHATGYYCTSAGCSRDLNTICPNELAVRGRRGAVIACASACTKFNHRDDYCCRNAHNTPQTCPPFDYSRKFKEACPKAYSYAYDDQASTFTCNGDGPGRTAYIITFC